MGNPCKERRSIFQRKSDNKREYQDNASHHAQRIGIQNEIAHWAEMDVEDLNIAATYNVVMEAPFLLYSRG